jgi:hypothetical protein
MLYCYKSPSGGPQSRIRHQVFMPTQIPHPHHHHPAGRGHPPASVSPSILRMALVERLAAAAVIIVVIWGAVFWAMS